jgi:N-succinyldiaminopimelate aminotransferase
LANGLAQIGFDVHDSFGTYFLCADPRPLGYHDSAAFCAALPEQLGVAAIPMSAFCAHDSDHAEGWDHLVRFTFAKSDDTLDEAIRRLTALKDGPPLTPSGRRAGRP